MEEFKKLNQQRFPVIYSDIVLSGATTPALSSSIKLSISTAPRRVPALGLRVTWMTSQHCVEWLRTRVEWRERVRQEAEGSGLEGDGDVGRLCSISFAQKLVEIKENPLAPQQHYLG